MLTSKPVVSSKSPVLLAKEMRNTCQCDRLTCLISAQFGEVSRCFRWTDKQDSLAGFKAAEASHAKHGNDFDSLDLCVRNEDGRALIDHVFNEWK